MEIMVLPQLRLIVYVLYSGLLVCEASHIQDEESLQRNLLSNYTVTVRPSTTVDVSITQVPLSLNSLEISQQEMSFTAIYLISWYDSRLTWTPSQYGGITDFIIPVENVWTPPIVVENAVMAVGKIGGLSKDNTPVRFMSTGEARWYPPLVSVTSCEMKISRYPFDTQTCFITLTSWGLSTKEMAMVSMPTEMTYYSANGEWELLRNWSTVGRFYDNSNEFTRLNIHYAFRRKWQFYSQNVILPIVMTSVLMTCVFALPLDSGEKMGYVLTVLLAYVVFLTWITDTLPSVSNDTSILQVYLACVLCLGILATVLTCWVLHMHHREPTYTMPALMRFFVRRLLVPLRNCTCCKKKHQNIVHVQSLTARYETSQQERSAWSREKPTPGSDSNEGEIEESTKKGPESDGKAEVVSTWQEVATMFDYLFLILYWIIFPVLTATVLAILYDGY